MANEPWYAEGLAFECTRCGRCCTGEPGFVWVNEEEVEAISRRLGMTAGQFLAVYTYRTRGRRSLREKANGDCVFYDREQGCTIYPLRPRQCRTWPFWESNLASAERWAEVSRHCPGIGRGEVIPVDEITRRVRVIRI